MYTFLFLLSVCAISFTTDTLCAKDTKPNPKKVAVRKTDYGVDDTILNRWSARAMDTKYTISDQQLFKLFEAAGFAPSSYNSQPWRFIYAKRGTSGWNDMLNLLVEFNKSWAKNASALVLIVAKTTFDHNSNYSVTHAFDTGAAWQNFALQASLDGLVAHGMAGFDYDRAKKAFQVPDGYVVLAMVAVGRPGSPDDLPAALREHEKPSTRKKATEIAKEATVAGDLFR